MKTLTYEDWVKNPVPRNMWVWDDSEEDMVKRKVVYFNENRSASYPVIVITEKGDSSAEYKHCAELEPKRRMSNKELARWLREHPSREYKYHSNCNYASCSVYSYHTYDEALEDEEINKDIVIREDYGEWKEPIIEDK